MYIFNIGLNHSGTTSLTQALNILGIKSLHIGGMAEDRVAGLVYMKRLFCNKKLNRNIFYGLDNRYRGFSDFCGEKFYKDLYYQYPNSKFIFTNRKNFINWFKSYAHNIEISQPKKTNTTKKMKQELINATEHYFNSRKEIYDFFLDKTDIFLEMNICDGDGWDKLCNFLEMDIPDVPFPYLNKRSMLHA